MFADFLSFKHLFFCFLQILISIKICFRVATSLSDVKSKRKRKTPADVNELQCMFLKKEMIKQDKEIIKLDLQIKLLQQLLDRTPTSPTYSQLLSAMF